MLDFTRLPLAVSSFETLRRDKLIYIDKTALIEKLLGTYRTVFLSRPRRFGKSLLVSTFASLFEHGLRDFRGLAIEKSWKDKQYPVVQLDFSLVSDASDIVTFQARFNRLLRDAFATIGFACDLSKEDDFYAALRDFFRVRQANSQPFVLLIDEYDSPLTHNINNEPFFDEIRIYMSGFFSVLKAYPGALRFLFITGITKYRQVSVFSLLNNLTDISLDPEYGELLGYTRSEIEQYFPEFLENALVQFNTVRAQKNECLCTKESFMQEMVANYDGFSFDEQAKTHVFAPWSVLNFLSAPQNGFKNYWIGSGGVSAWLSQWIQANGTIDPAQFDEPVELDASQLEATSVPSDVPPEALLFQTGYLSIRQAISSTLTLGYPNKEVSSSMAKLYFNLFVKNTHFASADIYQPFKNGDISGVIERFNAVFLSVPYDRYPLVSEAAVRGVVLSYVMGAGLDVRAETHNANGRSDLEVFINDKHWIFEFKFVEKDVDAPRELKRALEQIKVQCYGEGHKQGTLIRIGIVFSLERRQVVAYQELSSV